MTNSSTPDSSTAESFFATTSPTEESDSQPGGLDLSGNLPPPTALSQIDTPPSDVAAEPSDIVENFPSATTPRPSYTSLIAPSGSDTVTTTAGRVIVGDIIDESATLVVIQLESGNSVQIPHTRISTIERGRP